MAVLYIIYLSWSADTCLGVIRERTEATHRASSHISRLHHYPPVWNSPIWSGDCDWIRGEREREREREREGGERGITDSVLRNKLCRHTQPESKYEDLVETRVSNGFITTTVVTPCMKLAAEALWLSRASEPIPQLERQMQLPFAGCQQKAQYKICTSTLLKIGGYSNTPALYCQDMGC